jgi:putative phosphoesterase
VRVGLIADLHGNLAALDAVLAELEREQVDELVCLGDVAVGPQPGATVERLAEVGCPVVLGNWDAWFLDGFPAPANELDHVLLEMGEWWARELSAEHRAYLRSFSRTHELSLGDGRSLLCFHGSPRSYGDYIVAATPDAELERMLGGADADVLAGGHTHLQLVRGYLDSQLVNPGSVGLPFRPRPGPVSVARRAEYGIVHAGDGRLAVELRRTGYDIDEFLELARGTGMPHAEWWIGCWADG